MGLHAFSAFEAKPDSLADARRELWIWAEPVIADCASDWYGRVVADGFSASLLVRKHCRLWRSVILDQPAARLGANDDLRRCAGALGLDAGAVDGLNDAIVEELVDIVLCRFRASRSATKTFSMVLMSATSSLGAHRAAA